MKKNRAVKTKSINLKTFRNYVLIALLLILATFIMYSLRSDAEYADYTSYSTNLNGVKALYLLTGEMGFNTARFQKAARFLPQKVNATQVAVYPDEELFNDKLEIKYQRKWIEDGNTLIIVSHRDSFINYEIGTGVKHEAFGTNSDGNLIAGRIGKGWLLLFDGGEELLNEHINGVNYAVSFLEVLEQTGSKQVYFNEYYHNLNDSSILVLEIIGPAGRLILLQLAIALVALIIVLWKRFGKPMEVFEIIKRQENENLIAISNLYIKSKAERIVLETYLKGFRTEMAAYLGLSFPGGQVEDTELATAAAADKLLKHRYIGALLDECGRFISYDKGRVTHGKSKGRKDVRKLVHLVEKIEDIRREIK